jgi:predicted PhzF superfamily epimerase YddE/YHI9
MQLPFTTVDVFTTTPYIGNPLAIVRVPAHLRDKLSEAQKQKIAREFNLSETSFLHEPNPASNGTVEFDIFTPLSRMSFAGHPTIGTAVFVAQHTDEYPGVTALRTIAGTIPLTYEGESGRASVRVPHDFRVHAKRLAHPFPGAETNGSSSGTVPLVSIVKGMAFNLVPMRDVEALGLPTKGLLPVEECYLAEHLDENSGWDIGYTGTFYYADLGEENGVRCLRTRGIGTREDPGTGSASCALCSYLAVVARKEGGPKEQKFHLTQGVEMGRRCDIYITVRTTEDGAGIESVELSGTAVKVMEGSLTID